MEFYLDCLEQLFVYGTLRPSRPDVSSDASRFYSQIARYVYAATPASLPEAELYDCGRYPAARPGRGVVRGDLLTIAPAALAVADHIEGHPDFFRRSRVTVQTAAGSTPAWVYWAPEKFATGRPRIVSGDWFDRATQSQDSMQNTLTSDARLGQPPAMALLGHVFDDII